MDYIRTRYGVPAKRGGRIRFQGKPGVITSARPGEARLNIRLDGDKHTLPVHPTWEMEYEDAKAERKPRVWRHGDPEPTGHVRVRDNQGDIWQPMAIAPGLWETPETKPFEWKYVLRKWGPLVEVIEPDAGPETEPRGIAAGTARRRSIVDVHLHEPQEGQ